MEKIAVAVMAKVEGYGMRGQESAHEAGEVGLAGPKQQVKVVGHQSPGKTVHLHLYEEFGKTIDKRLAIPGIEKDVTSLYTPDDDVLKDAGYVKACGSWHASQPTSQRLKVN